MLDLRMPGLDGLELQRALSARGAHLPVIFVSGSADIPEAVAAMKQGAVDFLKKPADPDSLLAMVARAVQKDAEDAAGRAARDDARARWLSLSAREQDVCGLSARGMLNKQIAATLGINGSTAQSHRARALQKLGVGTVAELVQLMVLAGVPT